MSGCGFCLHFYMKLVDVLYNLVDGFDLIYKKHEIYFNKLVIQHLATKYQRAKCRMFTKVYCGVSLKQKVQNTLDIFEIYFSTVIIDVFI